MDLREEKLNKFKEKFQEEITGITDISELKDVFAAEIARRDALIEELRAQNEVLLKSAFKQKSESVSPNNTSD